jgi:hypothetical protein
VSIKLTTTKQTLKMRRGQALRFDMKFTKRGLLAGLSDKSKADYSTSVSVRLSKATETMTRPLLEVADIVRAQGNRFIQTSCRWIHWSHRKVLQTMARCRSRHCPKVKVGLATRGLWLGRVSFE